MRKNKKNEFYGEYIDGEYLWYNLMEETNLKLISKLEVERDELEQKLDKLAAFLEDEERLAAVSQEQNDLLHEQYFYMHNYRRVLQQRIDNLIENL